MHKCCSIFTVGKIEVIHPELHDRHFLLLPIPVLEPLEPSMHLHDSLYVIVRTKILGEMN